MSTVTALDTIVDAIVALIDTIDDIGLTYTEDIYSSTNLADLVVSTIDSKPTMRAWWISGPTLVSRPAAAGNVTERDWTFTIHGVEGLDPSTRTDGGGHIGRLRTNFAAVITAIDDDQTLGDIVLRKNPCAMTAAPNNTTFANKGLAYAAATVTVTTLSS